MRQSPADVADQAPAKGAPPGAAGPPGRAVCQLLPDIVDFVGRASERKRLTDLLLPAHGRVGVPIVVISGPPGIGKTTFALHAAHAVQDAFPGGQLYLELTSSSQRPRDPGHVLGEALRALGQPGAQIPPTTPERAALFRSRLAGSKTLVVIDDAGSADHARPLLPGTTGCAAVVTSRAQLGELPGCCLIPLDTLTRPEAAEMLGRIVGAPRVSAERTAADDIAAACGRLPLAIRIAAAKLAARPTWSLATLAGRLSDQRRRLDELVSGDTAVRAAFALSYDGLPALARRAFRRLALVGPLDVAEWVIAALLGEHVGNQVADILVGKSLLAPLGADATGQPRYRLHDLLRDYAAERLAEEPQAEQEAALRRVLTGLLELASLADAGMPRMSFFTDPVQVPERVIISGTLAQRLTADPWAWFGSEERTLIAATEWACTAADHRAAAKLACCQSAYQFFQGRYDDAQHAWQRVISTAATARDQLAVAHAELRLARMQTLRFLHAEAVVLLDKCIPVFEDADDAHALCRAMHWRAFCAIGMGQFEAARDDARRGFQLARTAGDRRAEALNLVALSMATSFLGDPAAGVRICERAHELIREFGNPGEVRLTTYTLAEIWIEAGRPELAADLCRSEITPKPWPEYVLTAAYFRTLLADAYHALGQYEAGRDEAARASEIFERYGARPRWALARYRLARGHAACGDYQIARVYLKECLPILGELRLSRYEQLARRELEACEARLSSDRLS